MSSSGGEMRGFVFSIVFIIVFSTLLSSIPVGLQGTGNDPDMVVSVDPSLLTGFSDTQNYTRTSYTGPTFYYFDYTLGSRDWRTTYSDVTIPTIGLFAKSYWFFLWLGGQDTCKFTSSEGIDRGTTLTTAEIATDATDGSERYSMIFTTTGEAAGSLVVYWNTTQYADPEDAWDNDVLYLLHGIGFSTTATNDIGALIVGLLFLQLPEVPVLINVFLAVPVWACIIFVLWFIIKEMIPFS